MMDTAAEIYQVQPSYRRFDQKYNLTRQSLWNPQVIELRRVQQENLEKHINTRRPGYYLRDWAFFAGATANMNNTGFSINSPNQRGNSWQPISRLKKPTAMMAPSENYGRLDVDPAEASLLVKKMSRRFGADEVGICLLDRKWVYSHWFDEETREHYPIRFSDEPGYEEYEEPVQLEDRTQVIPAKMKYAIVLIHEMDERGMATAPTLTQSATTLTTYSQISFTTVMLAEFIRGLGYHAIPSANDTAISIPMAIDAGLGELARNAKLVTPRFGPRCRVSKVITDLPLLPGKPRLWGVTEFCESCGKCARECPPGAIPTGERSFEPVGDFNSRGVLVWQLDHLSCHGYWAKVGTNCGICIRVCPFNKSHHPAHGLVRGIIRMRQRPLDRLLARADDWFGYGKFRDPETFWAAR
ncbi:MAG: reductive dehalogenase [Chloroflexota bacterium]